MKGLNQNVGAWTRKDDDALLRWYESHGIRRVMEETGRTWNAVKERARWYGLRVDRKVTSANRRAA